MDSSEDFEGKRVLRQPRFYWVTGIALILFGLAVEIGIVLQNPTFRVFDLINPALLALLIGTGILQSARNSIVWYDDHSLIYQNILGARKEILWSENPSLTYDHANFCVTTNRTKIPISSSRRGFASFLDFIIRTSTSPTPATTATAAVQDTPNSWTSSVAGGILIVATLWSTGESHMS
jgi:hypothetical protein